MTTLFRFHITRVMPASTCTFKSAEHCPLGVCCYNCVDRASTEVALLPNHHYQNDILFPALKH